MKIIAHINDDSDILEAWLRYYQSLGGESFHLIVHGPKEQNKKLYELVGIYPITIEEQYEGEFSIDEKERRVNNLLKRFRGEWVLLVDSDEFVEFPVKNVASLIAVMDMCKANALPAPMVQRLSADGSLETPREIRDPSSQFPFCSVNLHELMGLRIATTKFPLFRCTDSTFVNGGHHGLPNGEATSLLGALGVTHHFKWRQPVLNRLNTRAHSSHKWRAESSSYLDYLNGHKNLLPTQDSFVYSRRELFRRGLLKRPPIHAVIKEIFAKRVLGIR